MSARRLRPGSQWTPAWAGPGFPPGGRKSTREARVERVARFASTSARGPKPGRAGAGDAQRSGGAGWAGGRRRPRCILLNRPLSTLPTISLQRNVGKSVGFVFVLFCFVFPATCRVLRPRREPHTPPGARALTVKSARTTQSLQLPRREPTCPHPRAEPLRLDVDGGQLSSPAATSRNGSAEVLRSENGRRERTKALGCSPAPLPDVPLGRLPRASINPPHLSPSGLQVQDVLPRSVGQKGNYYIILDRKTEGWFPLINSKTQTDKAWGSRVEKGAECLRLDRKANHVCPSLISSQGYSEFLVYSTNYSFGDCIEAFIFSTLDTCLFTLGGIFFD
ncbi:uncharacterized protein [Tursiops truncatus]|uniref:uncharacterized protein n=1 Tax=Tursiops truncatus TaxID=9739 RepID=UPI003CCF97C0